MEKKKQHYSLGVIRQLIKSGCWRFTHAARIGALGFGLDEAGAVAVVEGLSLGSFYKSMTSHADHKLWQDVYRVPICGRLAYVKLTVLDDLVVLSFKEK
jgi:motility quorum-sensing regulator/GCU-specific mRNA interferase toxin